MNLDDVESFAEHFGELHRVTLLRNKTLYTLPLGETRPYFSFEKLARRVSEAHVSDNPVIRHTSVANKWKTVHLLLQPGHNATQIQYNLTLQREDETEFLMTFSVAVDTREVPPANVSQTAPKDEGKDSLVTPTPEPVFSFSDVPEDKRGPKIQKSQPGEPQAVIQIPSLNVSLLPAVVRIELQKLEEKLLGGDITVKGFNITKAELLRPYMPLAERQQDTDIQRDKVQRKPYKDLEEAQSEEKTVTKDEAGNIGQKKRNAEEEVSRQDVAKQNNPVTSLVPVRIDDKLKDFVTSKPVRLNDVIERPRTSKLQSGVSQKKSGKTPPEPAGAPLVGRRLQHFTLSDRGFLPWERRKYFQALLEVSRSYSLGPFTIFWCL